MTTLRAAAQQALEALEGVVSAHSYEGGTPVAAITALRAALAQPAPEPVECSNTFACRCHKHYTAPPQRKPLTEEDITDIWNEEIVGLDYLPLVGLFTNAVRAVEAAHGIKEDV